MAEIKIEKKKIIWPWLLIGLLVLAGILYFVFTDNDDDLTDGDDVVVEQVMVDNDMEEREMSVDVMEIDNLNAEALTTYNTAFTKYTNYIGDKSKMGIDHVYSNNALNYLIDAVEAKGEVMDVDINADLAQARQNAKAITKDPYDVNHADLIKVTGKIITRALTTLQKAKYPNLETELNTLVQAVDSITKEEHTLNQKGDVNKFYKAAEALLLKMK